MQILIMENSHSSPFSPPSLIFFLCSLQSGSERNLMIHRFFFFFCFFFFFPLFFLNLNHSLIFQQFLFFISNVLNNIFFFQETFGFDMCFFFQSENQFDIVSSRGSSRRKKEYEDEYLCFKAVYRRINYTVYTRVCTVAPSGQNVRKIKLAMA